MHVSEDLSDFVLQKAEIEIKRFVPTEHIYFRSLELARWIVLDVGINPLVDIDIASKNVMQVCQIIRNSYGFYPIPDYILEKIQYYEHKARNPNKV